MNHPRTIKGWITTAAAAVGIAATLAGGGWWFVQQNAWAGDVDAVVASVKTLRCDILDQKIRELEQKRAADELTEREAAWLADLLRQWDRYCAGGE